MRILSSEDFARRARANLPHFLYEYIAGGSFDEITAAANRTRLQAVKLKQRVLHDVARIDMSTTLFGQRIAMPIVLGPVFREQWKGPFIIKGLLDPADASAAAKIGADGIVVSNHGGRQLDGVDATVDALPAIAELTRETTTILVDGGVRSGLDVLKMLGSGAHGVLLGRAWALALAAGGERGVTCLLDTLRSELHAAMALTGTVSLAQAAAAIAR